MTGTLFKMAQAWKAKKEEGTVSTSLRVTPFLAILQILQDKLGELLASEDQRKAAEKHEWLVIGDRPLDPSWCLHTWSPAEKKSVRSNKDTLTHGQITNILGVLRKMIPEEHVLTRFHATRPLTERVLPFLLSVGVRSDPANEAHDALMKLVDCAALKVVGSGGGQNACKGSPSSRCWDRPSSNLRSVTGGRAAAPQPPEPEIPT